MSRIHDALKRATEERSSKKGTSVEPILAEVAGKVSDDARFSTQLAKSALLEKVDVKNPSLAQFQELAKRCSHPNWKIDSRMSVFQGEGGKKVGAERFRTLRSRLYQLATAQPLKRVLITSSVPAEGKSFVASNLAQSIIRQEDRRVLLIDADLRASRLHLMLGAPSSPGLAEYLRGEADVLSVLQNGAEGNLYFIPSGSAVKNPSELLASERMKKLLDSVTPMFDWILLDSPPTLPVHDASVLADLCDGVLFVVRAGQTNYEIAAKGLAEFREKNPLGVVLNGVVDVAEGYGYYYDDGRLPVGGIKSD
jgi:capsular exopolysaccharide synthesis family protein